MRLWAAVSSAASAPLTEARRQLHHPKGVAPQVGGVVVGDQALDARYHECQAQPVDCTQPRRGDTHTQNKSTVTCNSGCSGVRGCQHAQRGSGTHTRRRPWPVAVSAPSPLQPSSCPRAGSRRPRCSSGQSGPPGARSGERTAPAAAQGRLRSRWYQREKERGRPSPAGEGQQPPGSGVARSAAPAAPGPPPGTA